MIKTIPLNKLVSSPRNVRQRADEQADRQLKADIAARGLLQNLVVTAVRKPKGCFAVEAGERRRRALQALAEEGKLALDLPVSCLVVARAAAGHEASLAENFQRLAMNPADECLAFQQLIEQGADVEDIARRFGLTARFVEGRLRLADLAPEVFAALGAGEIGLDVAKAYAATPDRERQAWVFEQLSGGYAAQHPDSVRRMMTQATASAADRRARLVGEEAYLAAGGRIERDLFCDEDAARWLDVALLERLAGEKMAALAEQAAAETGLAFVRPVLGGWVRYCDTEGLRRIPVERPPLTDEETAKVAALEEEIGGLLALIEDEGTEPHAREQAEARVRELDGEIDAIADKQPVLGDALKALVGAFLVLDEQGRARLDTNRFAEAGADGEADGETDGDAEAEAPAGTGQAEDCKDAVRLSRRLVDELAMQRRDILALHVAADPGLALDLAAFLMIEREAGYSGERSGSSLLAAPPADPAADFHAADSAASVAREQAGQAIALGWSEGATSAERFDAFRSLPDAARAAWLGHALARTLEASLNLPGPRACAFHDHLGHLLGIDVARWWRPTGANYFDRVPKAMALAALEAVGGTALARRHAGLRKAELSQTCERVFAGDFIDRAEVKQAALAWVPDAMRFAPLPQPAAVSDGNGGGGADDATGAGSKPANTGSSPDQAVADEGREAA